MRNEQQILTEMDSRLCGLSREKLCAQANWRGSGTWGYWDSPDKRLPYLDDISLDQMYRVGFELWRFPVVRSLIEHLISYCVARGHKYVPQKRTGKSVSDGMLTRIEGAIEEVMDEVDLGTSGSGWYLLQEETFRRDYRDGTFFRKFGFYEDGRLWVRFIEPMDIRRPDIGISSIGRETPSDQVTLVLTKEDRTGRSLLLPVVNGKVFHGEFGIVSDLNDACTIIGFWKRRLRQTDAMGKISEYSFETSDSIQYGKFGVDMNDPRGVPAFYDLYCHCKQLEEVINAMVELSITQSSFAAVYTHKAATTADRLREIAKQTEKQVQENDGRPQPGQVIHLKGMELELPGMNVRATQYVELIQSLQRILGNVYGIPEFMATGDANTGNRSSLIAAEGPFALRIQREQKQMASFDIALLWKAVGRKLGWTPAKLLSAQKSVRIRAEFPTAAIRDWAKEMSVMLEMHKSGVISAQQINRRMDVDDEQMVHELNVRETTPLSPQPEPLPNNPAGREQQGSAN